jgi:hypothetical protein
MKGKNPIKTGVCTDFLDKIMVHYAEAKKSGTCACLQKCWLVIESQLQIWVKAFLKSRFFTSQVLAHSLQQWSVVIVSTYL